MNIEEIIEEIKAREQDAQCGEIGAVSDSQHDVKSLIAEVEYRKILESNYKRRAETAEAEAERLTAEAKCLDNEYHHYRRLSEEADQQIAALKKAYELMATAYGKYYNPYATPEERKKLLPQHMDYFMKQAQQLTHGEAEKCKGLL